MKVRLSTSDKVYLGIVYTILALIFIITLYPLIFVLSATISDPDAVSTGKMILWPVGLNLDGYSYLLQYSEIWTGYANTFFYTILGTLINLAVTIPAAYALSRPDLHGRSIFMTMFIITMYFSGGLIPGYLNLRELGMLNKRIALLIPGALSVYNLIVSRTFFSNTIPWELHEAAFLDGAKDGQIFRSIILPLSKPIIVVMTLYYGVGHWNSYFNAMLYLRDRSMFPLQVFLREILVQSQFAMSALQDGATLSAAEMETLLKQVDTANMLKYVVIVISTAPMLIIYPFFQKYFTKGVMIGSVKG